MYGGLITILTYPAYVPPNPPPPSGDFITTDEGVFITTDDGDFITTG
jgi:hypothetical protein